MDKKSSNIEAAFLLSGSCHRYYHLLAHVKSLIVNLCRLRRSWSSCRSCPEHIQPAGGAGLLSLEPAQVDMK